MPDIDKTKITGSVIDSYSNDISDLKSDMNSLNYSVKEFIKRVSGKINNLHKKDITIENSFKTLIEIISKDESDIYKCIHIRADNILKLIKILTIIFGIGMIISLGSIIALFIIIL